MKTAPAPRQLRSRKAPQKTPRVTNPFKQPKKIVPISSKPKTLKQYEIKCKELKAENGDLLDKYLALKAKFNFFEDHYKKKMDELYKELVLAREQMETQRKTILHLETRNDVLEFRRSQSLTIHLDDDEKAAAIEQAELDGENTESTSEDEILPSEVTLDDYAPIPWTAEDYANLFNNIEDNYD